MTNEYNRRGFEIMNRKSIYQKVMSAILGIVVLVSFSYTDTDAALRKPGITGASFLKIGVGARMAGLGSAATTLYGDPNLIFWSPAGIQVPEGTIQVGLNHNEWIADISHEAAAATYGLGNIGTIGVGVVYMGLSDLAADRDIAPPQFEGAQMEPPGTGRFDTYNYSDMAVTLAYSRRFTDRFVMGISGKFIQEVIDDISATAYAFDFGAIYETGFRDITIGARINNVGSDLVFYAIEAPIPLSFSIGLNGSLAKSENMAVKGFFDVTKPQDSPQLLFTGGEWEIMDVLTLRGGYKFNYSGTLDDDRTPQTDEGFTFGGGVAVPIAGYKLVVDYAATNFSIFQDTHRFSLMFEF